VVTKYKAQQFSSILMQYITNRLMCVDDTLLYDKKRNSELQKYV